MAGCETLAGSVRGPRATTVRRRRPRPVVGHRHHPAKHQQRLGAMRRSDRRARRRWVGWSNADHRRAEIVVDALHMARWQGKPVGTKVDSDRVTQYTSWPFGRRLRQAGLMGSMGKSPASTTTPSWNPSSAPCTSSSLGAARGPPEPNSPARSSNGSGPGTTPAGATPASDTDPDGVRRPSHDRPTRGVITTPEPSRKVRTGHTAPAHAKKGWSSLRTTTPFLVVNS